jgi:DNA-binding NarL/FixJ family response regulator
MTTAPKPTTPPSTPATTVRLFLVDDHPLVRDGLRARLGSMPNLEIVGEAGSAAEALELVKACGPTSC